MKMRNKGKVHPFTSSSSSSHTPNKDQFPVLNLLPAAILSLISILSLEDREVFAYMITRSLKSTNPSFFPTEDKNNKKNSKNNKQSLEAHHHDRQSPALFDCDCFHCYTSFWFRWDSSPNRELIHQAIEDFEEHLNTGEQLKKGNNGNGKNKRKEKIGRRRSEKMSGDGGGGSGVLEISAAEAPENRENLVVVVPDSEVAAVEVRESEVERPPADEFEAEAAVAAAEAEAPVMVVRSHKGLARKVLPDVMGIFSSRLWGLWSPNV